MEEEDGELGFDEMLIKECVEDPANSSWRALKAALAEKGVNQGVLSSKRKKILSVAREYKNLKKNKN